MPSRKRPAEDDTASAASPTDPASHSDASPNDANSNDTTAHSTAVKALVRLALTSEYARHPIRRIDITTHVLQPTLLPPRTFQSVFDSAQLELRQTFGMELAQLPAHEKVTVAQRRKEATALAQSAHSRARRGRGAGTGEDGEAQSTPGAGGAGTGGGGSGQQKAWILTSVLPARYHSLHGDTGVGPGKAPTEDLESQYAGLVTQIVSIIVLSGGTLAQGKLDRHLRRMRAEQNTPLDRTEKLLARMIKEGYIVRVKENSGGEEVVEYYVGPRGKIEIGEKGVKGLVRMVYGDGYDGEADAEIERRLERSLRVSGIKATGAAVSPARRDGGEEGG